VACLPISKLGLPDIQKLKGLKMKNTKVSKLIIVSTLAISLVACGQKTTEESLVSANQFIQSGKTDAAIIELKNAVALAPEDGNIRLKLGKLYVQNGAFDAAEKELHKARERGRADDEVIPLLAQVYYYTDQFDAAVKLLDTAKLSEPSALSTALLFQYLAYLQSTKDTTVISLEDIKASLSEQDQLVAEAFTNLYNKDYAQIEAQLQQLVDMNYRPAETEYLKALSSYINADYASAVDSFKQIKKLMPQPNTVNFQLVESMIKAGQLDEADKEADILLKLNSSNPLINFYKGNIAYKRKDFEQASVYTEKAIQNGLDSVSARMIAGVSAFQLESLELAYKHLHVLSQRQDFHSDDVNRLLARLQLILGYNIEASDSLQSLQQMDRNDAELFSLTGVKLAMSGNFGSANELLNRAQKLDESNNAVKMRLAAINIGKDEEQAISLLKEVVDSDEDLALGWMQLAMAHIRNGDRAAALDVAKQWYEVDKANGKTLEGVVYFNSGELDAALLAFNDAISIAPQQLGANQYLLQIYDQRNLPLEMLVVAKNILSFSPNNAQALIALVNSGNQLQQNVEIEAYLEKMHRSDNSNIGPLSALALSKRLNDQPKKAIQLLDKMDNLDPLGFMTLGDTYIQLGDTKQGLATYEKWGVEYPGTLFPYLRQIGGHELTGNDQRALELTESAMQIFPSQNMLTLLQLHYATKLNYIKKANLILQKIKQNPENNNNVLIPYYEGQLALNAMEYEKAEKLLSMAHSSSPTYISAAMLAKAMIANGHINQAKVMFKKQLNNGELVPRKFKNIVASFYTHVGEYIIAADMYQSLIAEHGEDAALLNNFAFNTLMAKGDLDVAKIAAEKAVGLAPDNADILDTLAWIEFKSNHVGEAYINISKAAEMKPASNDINLHYAEILISIGNTQKAKEILDQVKRPTSVESKTLMQLRKSL
jgi:putative PEP-CTERM system TPR-repeat lipoprotein